MKNLYISDLDGTLLDSDSKVSEYTARTLNSLMDKGMMFSFASARSPYSAQKVIPRLDIRYGIVYNGRAGAKVLLFVLRLQVTSRKTSLPGLLPSLPK